jgi:hypothetical protein
MGFCIVGKQSNSKIKDYIAFKLSQFDKHTIQKDKGQRTKYTERLRKKGRKGKKIQVRS